MQEDLDAASREAQGKVKTPVMQSSGLEDIQERIAAEKLRIETEIANKKLEKQIKEDKMDVNSASDALSDDDQKNVTLRDRKFTAEEIKTLEKKPWIEVKDLIFDTDANILDYLSFHCKRWR